MEAALLDELEVDFPATAEVPPMADAMVVIANTHDHLKAIADAGWRSPPEHPDLDPAHEALLMREHFTELLRSDYVQPEPQAFKRLLRDSEEAAQALEDTLRLQAAESPQAERSIAIQRLSARISANCKACHQQFRDVPLRRKHRTTRPEQLGSLAFVRDAFQTLSGHLADSTVH